MRDPHTLPQRDNGRRIKKSSRGVFSSGRIEIHINMFTLRPFATRFRSGFSILPIHIPRGSSLLSKQAPGEHYLCFWKQSRLTLPSSFSLLQIEFPDDPHFQPLRYSVLILENIIPIFLFLINENSGIFERRCYHAEKERDPAMPHLRNPRENSRAGVTARPFLLLLIHPAIHPDTIFDLFRQGVGVFSIPERPRLDDP